MRFFPQPKQQVKLSRQEALVCIPVRNGTIHCHTLETGEILLEYVLPLNPFFKTLHRKFQKNEEPPTRKLQLDSMGSLVWGMIDGENTTQSIIKKFSHHYSITLQEAETSVTTFLLELGKRGLIGMH